MAVEGAVRGGRRAGTSYHGGAMALHWLTALMVVGLLTSGTIMDGLQRGDPAKAQLLPIHASFGMTVLVLTLARIGLRFAAPPPKLGDAMAGWERIVARITHVLFYVLLLLLPLSGWVVTSVAPNAPTLQWFGLFDLPKLPPPPGDQGAMVAQRVMGTHELLGKVMMALIALHVLAALRHAFILKDGVLGRMWPGARA
jgi:cytochrome b561